MKIRIRVPHHLANPVQAVSHRSGVRRALAFLRTVVFRSAAAIALFAVFVLCSFAAMRIAIHGREVTVPNLSNLSDADAAETLKKLGLNLSVENRFYATTIPVNHVLSQSPIPGASVRRGWQIRVTESLGAQQVPVPDVTGQEEHPGELMLKRLQLDAGTIARIPAPGPAGVILAQSPPPNVSGLDGPRVALLMAGEEETPPGASYVMPSLIGLSVGAANERLAAAGLHIASTSQPDASLPGGPEPAPPASSNAVTTDPAIPPTVAPTVHAAATIVSQSPLSGHRVSRADNIRVTLSSN